MKKVAWALGSIMMVVMGGCSTVPPFPSEGARTIAQPEEFSELSSHAENLKGAKVQLAGRMVTVGEEDKSVVILAEWLPYPSDPHMIPKEQKKGGDHRFFSVRYPGPLPAYDEWPDNRFIVLGEVEGLRTKGDGQIPSIVGVCLHIWDRGLAKAYPEQGKEGGAQIDYLQHTHCVGSLLSF